jgi:hypothetical protein
MVAGFGVSMLDENNLLVMFTRSESLVLLSFSGNFLSASVNFSEGKFSLFVVINQPSLGRALELDTLGTDDDDDDTGDDEDDDDDEDEQGTRKSLTDNSWTCLKLRDGFLFLNDGKSPVVTKF